MTDDVMGSWTYTYDSMNRLASATANAGVDKGLMLGWTYDRYGNRWAQNATGTGNASAVRAQLTFYGNTNRIDGWSYSASGNLLNDQIHTYTYDAENRIATLNGEPEYIYDAEGRRVAKTNSSGVATAVYVLGLGGEQVSELNGSGAWVHSNVFAGGGRLLASYEGPAGTDTAGYHYHLTDWLGTKRMQTTAAGNQEETCMSYPFGDGLSCTGGPDATEHHFTGKERDAESGNDYFGARYLSSDLARFMTPDPIIQNELRMINPQRWNRYSYAIDSPLVFNDPSGKDAAYVNFSKGANGLGHAGLLSIHSDGSATYSSFGPKGDPQILGVGQVKRDINLPRVQFADGLPTQASYDALIKAVAKDEGQDPSSVDIDYFQTSDKEANDLDDYIRTMKAASDANELYYIAPGNNCADYALNGLAAGGAIPSFLPSLMSDIPNIAVYMLIPWSDDTADDGSSVTATQGSTTIVGQDPHTPSSSN